MGEDVRRALAALREALAALREALAALADPDVGRVVGTLLEPARDPLSDSKEERMPHVIVKLWPGQS